jgi:RHS repeat-associated protein
MGSTQQTFNNADELCWTASTSGSCASPPTGATTYTYDNRGNRTKITPPSGAATNLNYDQANRLTAYATTVTYAYNGDGLRMSKTTGGSTSQFLWDTVAAPPLLLKDGTTAYIDGPDDLPLEQVSGSTALWLHHDQIGSTRLVTNSAGSSQATYAFDPYGKLTSISGSISNPIRFGGQYFDAETGLYYLRARYYEPSTGQFLNSDPIISITNQPFAYARGNPINRVDPRGLYDYQYDQYIGTVTETGGAASAMGYLQANLSTTVPFSTGECKTVQLGESCTFEPAPFNKSPVTVSDVESQSFTLTSGSGHIAGAGGTITFSTYEKDGAVYLRETAHAPNANIIENIVDPPGAFWNWNHLASNLRQGLIPPCESSVYGFLIL